MTPHLYISFVNSAGKFLGGMFVQAHKEASLRQDVRYWQVPEFVCRQLPPQIDEMMIAEVPEGNWPEDHKWHNRLLTQEELVEAWGQACATLGELRDEARSETKNQPG